uniref:CSON013661 protein n=1 Tax=Culicoides sonorensis TaxID=179676 RepID=A0A336LHR5_CULSO
MNFLEDIKICRSCLGRERLEHMKDLQETVPFINYSIVITLEDIFYEVTGMLINKCEKITQLICSSCVGKLRAAYRFKLMAVRSYEKLCQVPSEDFLPHKPCRPQRVQMDKIDNIIKKDAKLIKNNNNKKSFKSNYFECDLCSATYPSLYYMRTHMKRYHIYYETLLPHHGNVGDLIVLVCLAQVNFVKIMKNNFMTKSNPKCVMFVVWYLRVIRNGKHIVESTLMKNHSNVTFLDVLLNFDNNMI